MQKRICSPTDTGHLQQRKVGAIGVRNDWWDIARDLLFCRILGEDHDPVDVDKVSEDSYKEVHDILSMAIKEFDFSKAAIHTVSLRMFQSLFSSTDNQICPSAISYPRVLCQTGS
jgi:hypothetical protein